MGYFDVANSPLLYVLVTAGVLYIVGPSFCASPGGGVWSLGSPRKS